MSSQSIQSLISDLRTARRFFRLDWGQRIAAANQLGNQRIQEATSALCEIVDKDENSELTQAAIQALGDIGSLEATDFLIRLLDREVGKPYQSAVLSNIEKCIETIGRTDASSAVPALLGLWPRLPSTAKGRARIILLRMNPIATTPILLQTLAVGSQTPQDLVKELLTQMATPDTLITAMVERPGYMEFLSSVLVGQGNRAIPALVKALTTREDVAEAIEKALYQMGDTVLPALVQGWATADEAGRQRIVRVLTRRGAAAVPTMITCMVAGGLGEKELAAGLSAMGEVAVLPLLAESSHEQVLGILAQMPDSVTSVIKRGKIEPTYLKTVLKIPNDRIQSAAIEQLAESGAEAIEPLLDLWQTGSPEVARHSEDALIKVGDPVVTRLVALLANPDGQMRRRVADLLSKMPGPTIAALGPSLDAWKSLAEPPQLVRVGTDGDVPDLAVAVDQAHEGTVLLLMAGDHTLEQPLLITKSIVLAGAGMERTRVNSSYYIRFDGDGPFVVTNLSVIHSVEEHKTAVMVASGVVHFCQCHILGSTGTGTGLEMYGNTSGNVRGCVFEGFSWGLVLSGQTQPLLEENLCLRNGANGIGYAGESGGVARSNRCTDNGHAGILVSDGTSPVLVNNSCSGNGKYGIFSMNTPTIDIAHNRCDNNDLVGIHVQAIVVKPQSTVHHNQCSNNGMHGIEILGPCNLMIVDNQCHNNHRSGINGDTIASFARNTCYENGTGISIGGEYESGPHLEQNLCRDNRNNGILFVEEACGSATTNTCQGNPDGICVAGAAHPLLENNICEENNNGISYWQHAAGTARGNRCNRNGNGIQVGDQATPNIEGNTCSSNKKGGIIFVDQSGGTADGNVCVGNAIGFYVNSGATPRFGNHNRGGNNSITDLMDER